MEKYSGLRLNTQFPFCSFPFVLDTYSECDHQCLYCFSYFNRLNMKGSRDDKQRFGHKPAKVYPVEFLKRVFEKPVSKQDIVMNQALEKRIPIHWGGITDPFSNYERKHGESLKIARYLAEKNYPYIVSTKGSIILEPEYKEALGNGLNIIQISLIGATDKLNGIELNSSVKDRLDAIEYYASIGKKVVVRFQPFIPKYGRENFEEVAKETARRGARAITVEFLKLTSQQTEPVKFAQRKLSKGVGYNVRPYYLAYGAKTGSDIEIKSENKVKDIRWCREVAKKYGLEFYCADNAFRFMGDSPICCGLTGNEKGFEGARKCTTSFALFKAMENGEVSWKDMDDKQDPVLNCPLAVSNFNPGTNKHRLEMKGWSTRDLLRYYWNTLRSPLNPSRFFENLKAVGKDKENNLIYKWVEIFKR